MSELMSVGWTIGGNRLRDEMEYACTSYNPDSLYGMDMNEQGVKLHERVGNARLARIPSLSRYYWEGTELKTRSKLAAELVAD